MNGRRGELRPARSAQPVRHARTGSLTAALVTATVLCACADGPAEADGEGAGVYRSARFGVSLAIPDDWHAVRDEATGRLMALGAEALETDDPELRAALEAAATTRHLVTISERPLDSRAEANANLVLLAERIDDGSPIVDGRGYLEQLEATMSASPMPFVRVGGIETVSIGGEDWHATTFRVAGVGAEQEYLAFKHGGHMMVFVITAPDEARLAFLRGVASTLEFDA